MSLDHTDAFQPTAFGRGLSHSRYNCFEGRARSQKPLLTNVVEAVGNRPRASRNRNCSQLNSMGLRKFRGILRVWSSSDYGVILRTIAEFSPGLKRSLAHVL
jgi:hypothetical protein